MEDLNYPIANNSADRSPGVQFVSGVERCVTGQTGLGLRSATNPMRVLCDGVAAWRGDGLHLSGAGNSADGATNRIVG